MKLINASSSGYEIFWVLAQQYFHGVQMYCTDREWQLQMEIKRSFMNQVFNSQLQISKIKLKSQ